MISRSPDNRCTNIHQMNPGSDTNYTAQNSLLDNSHRGNDHILIPDLASLGDPTSDADTVLSTAVTHHQQAGIHATVKSHVLLNENFDFVLSTTATSQSNGEATIPVFTAVPTIGPVEGTLIDLVDDGNNADAKLTIVDSHLPNLPTSPFVDTPETENDEESLYSFPSGGLEHPRQKSQQQPLLLEDESSSNHLQFDAMDRESEPLISYSASGRGRLGSTDVTLTLSVPGKKNE